MRAWLWDASAYRGITDDPARALNAAERHLADGDTARVELAIVVFGLFWHNPAYRRTGVGWIGNHVGDAGPPSGGAASVRWKEMSLKEARGPQD